MSYKIRKIKQEEVKILDTFLYEAIFIPEGVEAPPREIIDRPELQVYVDGFGTKKGDICFVAESDGLIVGAVWVRIMDQVELLYKDSDRFIENLYRNLKDCRIVTIGKNGAGSQRFVARLKKALSEEIDHKGIDTVQYKKTMVLLKFILHGVLGIISTESEGDHEIDYIKSLVKNGLCKDD